LIASFAMLRLNSIIHNALWSGQNWSGGDFFCRIMGIDFSPGIQLLNTIIFQSSGCHREWWDK